ncbi:hypothetical protein, partial [Variovorax boronicumulans]|uniref:hypothetical protein n=1 Tax=Variovorax boronicumulans TaxID=436515 RepID=UPI0027D7EE84
MHSAALRPADIAKSGSRLASTRAHSFCMGAAPVVSVVSVPSVFVDGFEQDWLFGAHGGRVHQEP